MDIFEKCYRPSMADEVREKGIYPYFHALESLQDTEVIMEGKRRIMPPDRASSTARWRCI